MDQQVRREIQILHDQVCYALGDPIRITILYALSQGPRFVNDLATELELPQPTISRHLKILRERSLVEAQRQGAFISYAIADHRIIQALDLLRGILRDHVLNQARLVSELTASENSDLSADTLLKSGPEAAAEQSPKFGIGSD